MRLKLEIVSDRDVELNVNYYYQLSSAIYLLLKFGSEDFAAFLHDRGYSLNGKSFKLFSFALQFNKMIIIGSKIKMLNPNATLFVCAPFLDEFIKTFVIGSFNRTFLNLNFGPDTIKFRIKNMELLPEPIFTPVMEFKLYSPIVLSVRKDFRGKEDAHYLRADNVEEVSVQLTKNLLNKYLLINNKEFSGEQLSLKWSEKYLSTHNRITKKITINENGRYPIDIIGMFAPFTLTGPTELMKIGYDTGFGEKNSMGFGMAQISWSQSG